MTNFSRHRLIIVCLLAAVSTWFTLAQPAVGMAQEPAPEAAPADSTPPVDPGPPPVPSALTFKLQAGDPFVVRAHVDGVVQQINTQPGAMLTKHQPILAIDPARLEVRRESLKAAYLTTFGAYRQAIKSQDPLTIAQAEARKQAAATAYDLLLHDIEEHQHSAPISGELTELQVRTGQFVHKGDPIASIADSRVVTVSVPLSAQKSRLGDKVALLIDGRLVDGTIQNLAPLNDEQARAIQLSEKMISATIELSNTRPDEASAWKPGQIVLPMQDPYAIVPIVSLVANPNGQTRLRVMRGSQLVELPAVPLASLKPGEQFVMADLGPGDLAAVPGPIATIPMTEPLKDLGTSDEPALATTESIASTQPDLLADFPLAQLSDLPIEATDLSDALSELAISPELAGLLTPGQIPLADLDLTPLMQELNLAPSDQLAFEQLQQEFQQMLDEKDLHITELADLQDIEGIAEYEKFLVAIRALNQDFAHDLLRELPEESVSIFEQELLDHFGLTEAAQMDLTPDLAIDQTQLTALDNEFQSEQFDLIKKLLNSETAMDQARTTLKELLDKKDQAAIDLVPEAAKDTLAIDLEKRQTRFQSLIAKPKPDEMAQATTADPASTNSTPRPAGGPRKFTPPPLEADTDPVMIGLFALIGLIIFGALGYVLGLRAMIKSLMTPSLEAGKKKKKSKLKHVNRIEVGPEKAFQTIRAALASVLDNPFVIEEIPWDRHEIVLEPGIYQEVIHLDESFPSGIVIKGEQLGQVTIVGDGVNPVVDAAAVTHFGLEGLVIDGEAAPTVIALRDVNQHAWLSQVIVTGFKQFGMRITNRNSEGELKVSLTETLFLSSILDTTGIFIDYGNLEVNSLDIDQCRFHGPMQQGLQFRSPLQKTNIRESIFAYIGTAISLAGTGYPFQSLKLSNNTFFRCGKGVFLRRVDALAKGERELILDNNLFSQSEQADLAVSEVVDVDTTESVSNFLHDFSNGNLTDREGESNFTSGLISLNGKAARYFSDFKFRSIEIEEPDFLMPTPDSPQRQAWSKKGLRGYVGALGPKSVVKSVMETQT